MEVLDPANMNTILSDAVYPFQPAVNVPAYDIGVLDKGLKITFPGSKYQGYYRVYLRNIIYTPCVSTARYDGIRTDSGQSLARWSSCCGKTGV